MGNLIETCGAVGISETLVRTAVSRLVAAGQLTGRRAGRRSYYALTDDARREFRAAARRVFEAPQAVDWTFVFAPDLEGALPEGAGFARLAPGWFLGGRQPPALPGAITFAATPEGPPKALQALVAAHWPVDVYTAAYDDVLARFEPAATALAAGAPLSPEQALHLRLLLVHLYRHAALRDPGLPDDAMPVAWSGRRARALFARLYLALSKAADAHVGQRFETEEGPLPVSTPETLQRLSLLSASAGT